MESKDFIINGLNVEVKVVNKEATKGRLVAYAEVIKKASEEKQED